MFSKTLLFADDSATMRSVMEKTFQGEDFNVVTVPSGQAAIEKARELSPDIIIADAGMTGVSGYDVCDAIRHEGGISATPVVIMSGISSPFDDVRGKKVDATEHIKKPFDTTKLIDRVKELCSQTVSEPIPRTSSGPGVAPARPSFNMPPVPKKDVLQDTPSVNSTLHAFPRPGLSEEISQPSPRSTQSESRVSFAGESPTSATPQQPASRAISEPEPIELTDDEHHNEIQVGTLAELAQMNERGGKVPQEVREDAIELEPSVPSATTVDTAAPSASHIPTAASKIQEAASKAATQIAQNVEGLTSDQAQAIMALTEDVVEKIVWEVVPDLAEAIIREKLSELLKE